MASGPKKQRLMYNKKEWISSIMSLCTCDVLAQITLTPMKILNCNATAKRRTPFTRAFCDTEYYPDQDAFVFGDDFKSGIDVLVDYFCKDIQPNNQQYSIVLEKLLDFMNGDRSIHLNEQRRQKLTQTELTIMVANHFWGKLATSSCYLVDKNCTRQNGDKCFCEDESCKMTGQYSDTSVGNVDVWYGNLDIIINNDIPVEALEDVPDNPGGKSAVEIEVSTALEGNEQIIAQTIVFSFLQRKTHPNRKHFLTPCIGIRSSELLVMLYDSENDVLLESSCIPLFRDEYEFNYTAILVSWLTVNYKFLCTGLPEGLKKHRSNFFDLAKPKMEVYMENLSFGSVCDTPIAIMPKGKFKKKNARFTLSMHEHTRTMIDMLGKLQEEEDSE